MDFVKKPGFGKRFTFPENVEIKINGDTLSTYRQAVVRMVETWEESVVSEILKEAKMSGYTEVTVLDKATIFDALNKYCKPPVTNADAIRAMTDGELEAFLIDVALEKGGAPFIMEWGEWLGQPVTEMDWVLGFNLKAKEKPECFGYNNTISDQLWERIGADHGMVIRCHECQGCYASSGSSTGYRCRHWGAYDMDCECDPNGFCNKAERRKEDDHDV